MPSPELLGVVCAAFFAGMVDAVAGGGGLIQLPAPFGAFPNLAPPVLLGTSKLAGALGTGTAAWRYSRHLVLPWRRLVPGCTVARLSCEACSSSSSLC